MQITINGKSVDLARSIPLTLGDLRRLKTRGVDLSKFNSQGTDPDLVAQFVLYLVNKANPEVTLDDIDTVPMGQLGEIITYANKGDGVLDRPT